MKKTNDSDEQCKKYLRKYLPEFYNSLTEAQKLQLWAFWDNGYLSDFIFENIVDAIIIDPRDKEDKEVK